ncbi:hypothetical protein ACX64O_27395 [Pseudomonas fitomaticsae]
MASIQKQTKRAKRAKTKAKQARAVRNNAPKGVSEELLDDIAQGMVSTLIRLAEAEDISMVNMLMTLIRETSISDARSLDEEVDNQIIVLTLYGRKVEGRSEDWLTSSEFLKAYSEAANNLGREELIEAWHDAHDLLIKSAGLGGRCAPNRVL